MPTLRRLDSQGKGVADYQLGAETWIGRAPENEILLGSNDVSRRHARVLKTERGYLVMDNDSQNGVVVRGERVHTHFLVHGDVVTIGSVALEFVDTPELGATVVLERPGRPAPRVQAPAPPSPPPPPPPPTPQPAAPVQPVAAQPVPAQPPATPKKGCGWKGCAAGCLAAFVLLFFIAFGAYVYFVKPPWAGKLKFWRTSLHPERELPSGPSSTEPDFDPDEIERRVAASKEARAEADRMYGLNRVNYVRKSVSAATGDRLQTPQGASLDIPPYALDRDAVVELAPRTAALSEQRTDAVRRISDVYSIRVDGREHTEFRRPLTLEIPALLEMDGRPVTAGEIGAYWWDGTAWQRYPSAVTIEGDKIRFQVEHATDITGAITGLIGGLGSVTGTRGELEPWISSWRFAGHEAYRTPNFAVYYVAPAAGRDDAVPADSAYPLTKGRKAGAAPYYVIDIADALEATVANAKLVGIEPNTLWFSKRHTAMIEPAGAFGVTPLGGPMYLDNAMAGLAPGVDFGEFVKTTATHEFLHVVQDEYFNNRQTYRPSTTSFMETTAQAISDLLRFRAFPKEHPSPYLATNQYLLTMPEFIRTPIDAEGRGEKALSYAWGTFLIWMEIDGGFPQFSSTAMKRKAAATQFAGVPNTMAQVAAEMRPGQSISDAFTRFAAVYLHDDLWDGRMHTQAWWSNRDNVVKVVERSPKDLFFRSPKGTEESSTYFFTSRTAGLDHLTARFDMMDGTSIRNDVPGKLYIRVHDVAKSGGQLLVFADEFNQFTPKRKGVRQDVRLSTGTEQTIEVSNFGNHTPSIPLAVSNRLNLVLVNDKPDEDGLDFSYDIWLLLPPSNVLFDKRQSSVETNPSNQYVVNWSASPLQKATSAFRGYNVYRRKLGDSVWPATPVNAQPISETKLPDTPPDQFDYEYAVTTVDTYSHESEKSLVENDDPFAGEWSGSFALKSGTLIEEEKLSKEQKEMYKGLIPLLKKAEAILKFGVAFRFRLERTEGKYYLKPISIFGKTIVAGDTTGYFKRISKHNLQWIEEKPSEEDKKKPPPPLYFSLEYPEEIHNTYSNEGRTLEWRFVRAQKMSLVP